MDSFFQCMLVKYIPCSYLHVKMYDYEYAIRRLKYILLFIDTTHILMKSIIIWTNTLCIYEASLHEIQKQINMEIKKPVMNTFMPKYIQMTLILERQHMLTTHASTYVTGVISRPNSHNRRNTGNRRWSSSRHQH